MASAYSQVQTYLPYIPTQDLNLVNTVLATKEAKFDANLAEMDNLLAEYGNIDIYKDSDKEYLYNRLKTFTDTVNKYGKIDWSNTDVSRNIKNQIKGVLDKRVVKAIGDTKRIQQYGASVEQAKKDGTYSDMNYQVGLMKAGFTNWMNDDTGTVELGNLNYTPYTDVQADLLKSLKEVSSIKGGKRVIQTIDGEGRIIERTIDGLTQKELEGIIPSLVNTKMRDQLAVEGYYRFQGNKDAAQKYLRDYHKIDLEGIDSDIKNLQTQIDSGKFSTAQTEQAKYQIAMLEAQKSKKQQQIESIASQDAGYIGGYLEEQSLIGRLSTTLIGGEGIKYLKDDTYFARLEAQEKERKSSFALPEISDVTAIPIATEGPEEIDVFEFVKTQGEQLRTGLETTISTQYNSLSQEQKDSVDNLMGSAKYAGLSERDKRLNAMRDSGVLDPEVEGDLNRMERKYKAYLQDDEKIYAETLTRALQDTSLWDEFQDDSFFGNANIKILDENGQKVTYKEYLRSKGVTNKQQYANFVNDTERSRDFKGKMLADFLLSSSTKSDYAANYPIVNNLGKALQGREAGNIDQNLITQFDRLTRVMGENLSFTDLFEVRPTQIEATFTGSFYSQEGEPVGMDYINDHKNDFKETYTIKLKDSAAGTKTYNVLKQNLDTGTFDTSSFLGELLPDNSVQDDSNIRRLLSTDTAIKAYEEEVTKKGIRVKGANAISIAPSLSSSEKNRVPTFEDLRKALAFRQDISNLDPEQQLTNLEYGKAVNLQRSTMDPTMFVVTQENRSTMVSETALRQYPNLSRSIEFSEGGGQIVTENNEPIKKERLSFKQSNERNNIYLGNRYGFGSIPYLAATKQGARQILKQTYPEIYDEQAPPYWAQTFDVALNNIDKFTVSLQEYRGRNFIEVYYDGEKISEVAGNIQRENVEDILDYDPQIFATMALNNIAIELATENTENFAKLYGRTNRQ